MALVAGDVSIADDGTETKSGLAEDIFDLLVSETNGVLPEPLPTGAEGAEGLRGVAVVANAIAKAIVPYLLSNLEVRARFTSGGDAGLQRTSDASGACAVVVDTLGPSPSDKVLSAKADLL